MRKLFLDKKKKFALVHIFVKIQTFFLHCVNEKNIASHYKPINSNSATHRKVDIDEENRQRDAEWHEFNQIKLSRIINECH